ncbi:MAG: decaprenyl-phosphate phosphoribosyltransferase [Candidatus Gracilibacteria bacterium]|nr:decaprenyl-phosphate phosphoribosyltransferase [Candidatus Gracilibacteria bacterium]
MLYLIFIVINYLRLLRVNHWIKNVLIFAPLFFAGGFFDPENFQKSLVVFGVFSLLASMVYIINDIVDLKSDQNHPKKKNRPLASGKISIFSATLFLVFLSGFVIVSNFYLFINDFFSWKVLFVLSLYLVMNLLYSFKLKQIPVVEIMVVAFFYLIRVYVGAEAVGVMLSHWIIICTFFIALFLTVAKRRSELVDNSSRSVLSKYSISMLDFYLIVSVSLAILSYTLFASLSGVKYLLYSFLIVCFALFRYVFLIYSGVNTENPEKLLFKDFWLVLSFFVWCIFLLASYYLN